MDDEMQWHWITLLAKRDRFGSRWKLVGFPCLQNHSRLVILFHGDTSSSLGLPFNDLPSGRVLFPEYPTTFLNLQTFYSIPDTKESFKSKIFSDCRRLHP